MSVKGGGDSTQLDFLWRGLGPSCHTCRRSWFACRSCRRARMLGVENQAGVSFISTGTATEAMVVSIDSSSMSSMFNESTRKTSFVTSATVLKEISLMGLAPHGSFVGVGACGSFVGVGTYIVLLK